VIDAALKPLKAYTVHDGGDHSVIRFAASNVVARREGANELGCEFNEVDYCTRSPEFDAYAPGPVPPLVAIKHGWWFECRHCGQQVNEYSEGPVIEEGDGVYCSPSCEMREFVEVRARAAAGAALIEVFEAMFSGAIVLHAYANLDGHRLEAGTQFGSRHSTGSMITFKFPGATGVARWVFGDDDVTVDRTDIPAFCAWRGKPVPANLLAGQP